MTDHKALRLVDVLRDQRQCDEDGVMCIVSRQAVDEAVQLIEGMTAAPAASEGEDGAVGEVYALQTGERRVELNKESRDLAVGTKLYTRPAAQVAATPKHDEGRYAADALRQAAEYVCTAAAAQNVLEIMRGCERLSAALTTQPAARRVTDEDVERARTARMQKIADLRDDHKAGRTTDERVQAAAMRAALESLAQPAEGRE